MPKFYVKVVRSGTVVQTVWLTVTANDATSAEHAAAAKIEAEPEDFSWDIGPTDFDNYEYKVEKGDE